MKRKHFARGRIPRRWQVIDAGGGWDAVVIPPSMLSEGSHQVTVHRNRGEIAVWIDGREVFPPEGYDELVASVRRQQETRAEGER